MPTQKISDLHAREERFVLSGGGLLLFKLFVVKKINTINLKSSPLYKIRTSIRLSLDSNADFSIQPGANRSYENYPAILSLLKSLICLDPTETDGLRLTGYSPKTINSSISTSRSDNSSDGVVSSSEHSTGSTTSQTNSFGVNVQAGEMMELPMFSIGLSYDHAYASSQSTQDGVSSGANTERQIGASDTFSIKDWGMYAKVNRQTLEASWICAQEYPWDVLQYRSLKEGTSIELPASILARMINGNCVLPPSQLSLFGPEFMFTADWTFQPRKLNMDPSIPLLSFALKPSYARGSHQRTGSAAPFGLAVSLHEPVSNAFSSQLTWGELEWLALDALVPGRNDSSLNFEKLPSTRFPPAPATPLTVAAPTNTLFCMATGFGPGMIADTAKGAGVTLKFKVTDTVGDLALHLRHWKIDSAAVVLNITVNDAVLPSLCVDAQEGEGAMGNRAVINLRTTDYMAADFVDHVVVGLNTITLSIAPKTVPSGPARYCLAAAVVS